jgi:plastocyanin
VRSADHLDRERIPPEPQGTEPNRGTPGAQDATGGKVDVSVHDGRFAPPVMHVRLGQIVVFTNEGTEPHTVRATDRDLPRSGAIPAGGRFEYTALRAGRVRYACSIHPAMQAALVVRRS